VKTPSGEQKISWKIHRKEMYLLGSDLKRPSYPTAKFSWSFADHTNSTAVMYVIYADHAKHRCTSCLPFCQKWCICALTLLMAQARTMSIVCWLLFLMAEERTMPSIQYVIMTYRSLYQRILIGARTMPSTDLLRACRSAKNGAFVR
jgi:hypothetical protein